MKTSETAENVALTILEQLGGKQFLIVTGIKKLVYGTDSKERDYALFLLPRNPSKANRFTVRLEWDDTYTVEFERVVGPRISYTKGTYTPGHVDTIYKADGIYCDGLEELFRRVTKLETRLF